MPELSQRIKADMITAMKARESAKLATIRLITAAIKQFEVDQRATPDDAQVIEILSKMAKQRRESIDQFTKGGRNDLVAIEEAELVVIQDFLPQPLTDSEISQLIDTAITTVSATGMADMGKVMGQLKPEIQGRADGKVVSDMVKQKLQAL